MTIAATRDTSVQAITPNQNFGTRSTLDVNRTLVAFSPASLSAAVGPTDHVVSAKLRLTISNNKLRRGAAARAVSLFRLNKDWTETGATWNCAIDSNTGNSRPDCSGATAWSMGVVPPNPWATPASTSATIAPAQTSVVLDVTADVRSFLGGAPNKGWVLYSGPLGVFADFAEFASRESNTPPRLELTVQRCSASLCDDGNACTVDSCDAVGECQYAEAAAGTSCTDGNACTGGDQCSAGVCSPGAEDLCVPPVVVLNEAESSGGVPGDWAELYNAGTVSADISGWIFRDADNTHTYVIPAGTILPVGGYLVLEEAQFGFGLGTNESVRLFNASDVLVDTHSWGPHAVATTYGRCPNGTGAFTTMTTVTKGAANDCSTPPTDGGVDSGTDGGSDGGVDGGTGSSTVVVNEVESNGGVPGDWTELYNTGSASVDLSGWSFRDNDTSHAFYVFPAGSVIAAGGFFLVEEAQQGFGLGAGDASNVYDASGALVATYSWTTHATTSYGRCPDGTGTFATTTTTTKGAANDCSTPPDGGVDGGTDGGTDGGGITYNAWPGGNSATTVDEPATFGGNLSGLTYEPASASAPAILWAVQNSPAVLYKLVWNGINWVSTVTDGWDIGKTLTYPNGTGVPDCEGVTRADLGNTAIYVATERNNSANAVSRLSVLRFDVSATGTTIAATHEWNFTADLPAVGPNLGLEAITFVPDEYLLASGFIDESTGLLYDPMMYPDHAGGIFLVGVEASGVIYAYVLDHGDGTFQRVATILSGHVGVMGLELDPDNNVLWAHCDNTCNNRSTLLEIETDPMSANYGRFVIRLGFERPTGIPATMNNEGIAIAPESECVGGFKSIYWTDDGETDAHSLRADTIPCGPLF